MQLLIAVCLMRGVAHCEAAEVAQQNGEELGFPPKTH